MFGMVLQATISSTWSELRRTVSGQKLVMALVLSLFPPFIMYMIFSMAGQQAPPELVMAILLWMVGLLSLILWLPPGVYSELEGQTWILSTSRPYGRVSMLLGKYFSAIVWTMTVLTLAYAITTLLCWPLRDNSIRSVESGKSENVETSFAGPAGARMRASINNVIRSEFGSAFNSQDEARIRAKIEDSIREEFGFEANDLAETRMRALVEGVIQKELGSHPQVERWLAEEKKKAVEVQNINLAQYALGFLQVCFLAALAYGAVFSLLSVLALKRAMGFAVGYVIVSEVLLASVPAMVQKFTVRYHLQSVGLNSISDFGLSQLEDGGMVTNLVLNEPLPLWGNYLCLTLGAMAILSVTILIANWRQLITVHET